REIGRDFHQWTGAMAYLRRQADQYLYEAMDGVVHGQAVDLRIRFLQGTAEHIDQGRDQIRLVHQQFHDLFKRDADRLGRFQRDRPVRTHRLGGAKFANDIATFAHVVDHFAPMGGYRSDPYKAVLQEEERLLPITYVVDHRMLAEGRHFPIG